jgi:lipid A 3-O-deacylase PagL
VHFSNKIPLFSQHGAKALLIGLLLAVVHGCSAQDILLDSAGGRFGFSAEGAGRYFHQAEAFVNWDLPWNWDLGESWLLQSRLDVSAGWIGESSANAAIATLGPTLALGRHSFPVSFECGVSPTVLTRSDFPTKDFGIPFQFTSHGGVNFDITSHIRLSYRFQHMSDASLSRHNPGLNLQVFGLSYLF